MKIPYGVADFERMRTGGYAYVDRTAYIREIEELADVILFVRPRRFSKSLWLRTLIGNLGASAAHNLYINLGAGDLLGVDRWSLTLRAPWQGDEVMIYGRLEAGCGRRRDEAGADR